MIEYKIQSVSNASKLGGGNSESPIPNAYDIPYKDTNVGQFLELLMVQLENAMQRIATLETGGGTDERNFTWNVSTWNSKDKWN